MCDFCNMRPFGNCANENIIYDPSAIRGQDLSVFIAKEKEKYNLVTNIEFTYLAMVEINYCPMCGRKLRRR